MERKGQGIAKSLLVGLGMVMLSLSATAQSVGSAQQSVQDRLKAAAQAASKLNGLQIEMADEGSLNNHGLWLDDKGKHINAHGGNIIRQGDTWFWYGENRPYVGFSTETGIEVYVSKDLVHWHDAGVALSVSDKSGSPIERGCIMERPKVLYNLLTNKYVMLFHLELKGRGYEAAEVGFAVSDTPVGPFQFVRALRPNPGVWPANFSDEDIQVASDLRQEDYAKSWTPEWCKAVEQGLFTARDLNGGQMSRDMTVFVDDDGRAYQITSSEENMTIQINELTSDYLDFNGCYYRAVPGGQNEAPTILKHDGRYWMICSGCTGWTPNEARMYVADKLSGPWTSKPSPMRGPKAKQTFGAQGTYILNTGTQYLFMADVWNPRHLSDSRHIWLPITFAADGSPVIIWHDYVKP